MTVDGKPIIDQIFCGDAEKCFKIIPDNFVHLVVTSPPYNIGIKYDDYSDDMPYLEYLDWLEKIWRECERVLVEGGRLCINIGENKRLINELPLHCVITYQCLTKIGFLYRATIIWNKNSANKSTAWGSWNSPSNPHILPTHEYIIIFSKKKYKLDGNSKDSTLDKDGKEFSDSIKSVWNIGTESRTRIFHPTPFPVLLPKKLINFYTYKNQVVLDPFGGSGTTAVAAFQLSRKFILFEKSKKYCEIALQRLNKIDSDKKFSITLIK